MLADPTDPDGGPPRIRVALIGAGSSARECLAPRLLQNPAFHLRALWAETQEEADQFNFEVAGNSLEACHGDEGFKGLLERADIDGCAVSLPVGIQQRYITQALQHRKHVLSDRPIAETSEEALEVLRQREERKDGGPVWFVAQYMRYEAVFCPEHLKLAEIGPIVAAEVNGVLVVPCEDGPVRTEESLFIEGGAHYISALRQLLGSVTEVNCTLLSDHRVQGAPPPDPVAVFWSDAVSGVLRFESGVLCALNWQTSAREEDERFRVLLRGVEGVLSVELDRASLGGVRRYVLRRQIKDGACGLPEFFQAIGGEQQLEVWGHQIRRRGGLGGAECQEPPAKTDEDHSPSALNAIVDLMVVGAMLRSHGGAVQIRERP